jgi:hypothetical protein
MQLGMHIMPPDLNGILHKSLTSVLCVRMSFPSSLTGNGSVETLPRGRLHKQQQNNCWRGIFIFGKIIMFLGSKVRRVRRANNLTAIYEPIV